MREFLAGIGIAFISLFGGGEPAQPQPASLTQPASEIVALAEAAESQNSIASSATTTIINQYITQPVIEREVLAQNAITREELDASLAALRSDLLSVVSNSLPKAYTIASASPAAPVSLTAFAHSQKIDNLSHVTISNSTIDTASIPDLSGNYLSIASTSAARTTLELSYASTTDVDDNSIAVWGDSITAGLSQVPFTAQLASLSEYEVYNGGVGGDTSTQIRVRMLASPDKWTWPTIIWAGRNNFSTEATVEADIAAMVAALQSVGNDEYIILGVLNSSAEPSGSASYNSISALNSSLATTYGSRFIDIRSYLVSQYNPSLPQDVIDYGNDVPPTSLELDGLHLNTAGYAKVAARIYESRTILGLRSSDSSVITPSKLARFANNFGRGGLFIDGLSVLNASSTAQSLFAGQSAGTGLLFGSLNTAVGYAALSHATSSNYVTAVGASALYNNTASSNSAFGAQALRNNTTGSNDAFGLNALYTNTTGTGNIAFGQSALTYNLTGNYNAAFGIASLTSNTSGNNNASLGHGALYTNTTGSNNIAVGFQSLYKNSTASNNIGIGIQTLFNTNTGANNAALGATALYSNTTGAQNVAMGTRSAYYSTTASNNTAIGYQTGYGTTANSDYNSVTDSNMTFIGANASRDASVASTTSLTNATAIGYSARVGASNSLVLGGTGANAVKVGMGTTTPWRTLSVTGTVGFDGLTGATGAGSLCLSANREVVYNSGSDSCLSSTRATKHDITALDLSALDMVTSLKPVSFIYNNDASSTVRYGFIAEDTAAVDSHLATYDQAGTISGIDDRSIISIVVKAIQELGIKVGDILDRLNAHDEEIATLKAEVAALKSQAGAAALTPQSQTDSAESGEPDTEAPTITINGNNPATLSVGDTYADLGATVTDNVDLNLGLHVFVGGTPMDQAVLDTSEANEWHIHYVATDNAGNTATSTRTVIVESPSIVPDEHIEETEPEEAPVSL